MSDAIIFAGTGNDDYVELSADKRSPKAQGRVFKKKILHMKEFANPGDANHKIKVDFSFAQKLVENFKNGVCDIVQVPIVDDQNRHVEDPLRNIGRVIDLSYDENGIYAYIDAVKHADDLGKTLIGASASMHLNYKPNSDSPGFGPTLLHVAVTNRPYITKLSEFEEIGLSAPDEETVLVHTEPESNLSETKDEKVADTNVEPVLLGAEPIENPDEEKSMTKEELIAALKEQGIDVVALQKTAEETANLSNIIAGDTSAIEDVSAAVVELSHAKDELEVKLSNQIKVAETQNELIETLINESKALKLSAAEAEIDGLVKEGRVLPKQREAMLKLSVNDRETFVALLPDEALVSLSENGVTTHQDTRSDKLIADLERYTKMARGETVE